MEKKNIFIIIVSSVIIACIAEEISNTKNEVRDDSGRCGDYLSWTLNRTTMTLTVSGNGLMTRSCDINSGYTSSLKSVVIEMGVLSIARFCFSGFYEVINVTIPDSVETIEGYAFNSCSKLENLIIGNSVKSIGGYAFSNCHSLKSFNIPDSVSSVGYGAFSSMSQLKTVFIGKNTTFGGIQFERCPQLSSISVSSDNAGLMSKDGVLFSKSEKPTLIRYPCGKGNEYTIPETVSKIGPYSFSSCANLTKVNFNSDLEIISDNAFLSCTHLQSVVLPDKLRMIDVHGFDFCTSLTSVTFGSSLNFLGKYAFMNCYNLENLKLPASLTEVGERAFDRCDKMEEFIVDSASNCFKSYEGVLFDKNMTTLIRYPGGKKGAFEIPESVTATVPYAFAHSSGLTSVTMPDSLRYVGDYLFYNCTNLKSVKIGENAINIGEWSFMYCFSLESVVIPDLVKNIKEQAFDECSSMKQVTFGKSVQFIGTHAFNGCSNLTTLTLPASLSTLSSYAFRLCTSLKTVKYLGTNDPGSSSSGVFYRCNNIEYYCVPENYESIVFCGNATSNMSKCDSVTISSSSSVIYTRISVFSLSTSLSPSIAILAFAMPIVLSVTLSWQLF